LLEIPLSPYSLELAVILLPLRPCPYFVADCRHRVSRDNISLTHLLLDFLGNFRIFYT